MLLAPEHGRVPAIRFRVRELGTRLMHGDVALQRSPLRYTNVRRGDDECCGLSIAHRASDLPLLKTQL